MANKKTVVFDFDGVIHSYTSGWKGATIIPDPPTMGIKNALKEIHNAGYEIVVVSTRCVSEEGIESVREWLYRNDMLLWVHKICKEKPPAVCYIDDRAICFKGNAETLLDEIQNFKSWTEK